ncbi:phage holin family protein [Rhizobium sp. CSW-27]|uniref:phage holin family protein n=1 Tax=Rhizobium sp. CSW-27 TaxID=2839985 RepID=UPI001C02711D|nr:phage holin family protein [Rhizobium sp. CSW-27]MBT9370258.1 phage holin family protein [Rhizobium sp. CSW-27]
MSENYKTFAEMIDAWLGGAGLTLIGSIVGRAMWHVQQARKGLRRFFGPEILWELPIAIGMAMIGEGVAAWLDLVQPTSTGLIAALAYLGPRGTEVLFMRWFGRKIAGE